MVRLAETLALPVSGHAIPFIASVSSNFNPIHTEAKHCAADLHDVPIVWDGCEGLVAAAVGVEQGSMVWRVTHGLCYGQCIQMLRSDQSPCCAVKQGCHSHDAL